MSPWVMLSTAGPYSTQASKNLSQMCVTTKHPCWVSYASAAACSRPWWPVWGAKVITFPLVKPSSLCTRCTLSAHGVLLSRAGCLAATYRAVCSRVVNTRDSSGCSAAGQLKQAIDMTNSVTRDGHSMTYVRYGTAAIQSQHRITGSCCCRCYTMYIFGEQSMSVGRQMVFCSSFQNRCRAGVSACSVYSLTCMQMLAAVLSLPPPHTQVAPQSIMCQHKAWAPVLGWVLCSAVAGQLQGGGHVQHWPTTGTMGNSRLLLHWHMLRCCTWGVRGAGRLADHWTLGHSQPWPDCSTCTTRAWVITPSIVYHHNTVHMYLPVVAVKATIRCCRRGWRQSCV